MRNKIFAHALMLKHDRDGSGSMARALASVPLPTSGEEVIDADPIEGDPENGPDAVQTVAAAPVVPVAVVAGGNRFVAHFGEPYFEAEDRRKPFMYPENVPPAAQTAQTALAQVHFPCLSGIPGFNMETARIVQRETPDRKVKIALVMPSVSLGKGAPKKNIYNLKAADAKTRAEYVTWQKGVVDKYSLWRKAQIASGFIDKTDAGAFTSNEQELTEAEQIALGLHVQTEATK